MALKRLKNPLHRVVPVKEKYGIGQSEVRGSACVHTALHWRLGRDKEIGGTNYPMAKSMTARKE